MARERALDISTGDTATATRVWSEAEVIRGRLKLSLPQLQHKLQAAYAQEQEADWEKEYNHIEAIRDKRAEKWARVPKLIDELIEIFRENEALNKQMSNVNGAAPPGKRRLPDAELLWRSLDAFSRSQPPISKGTTLPICEQSELSAWPPKPTFSSAFMPAPQDIRHTADWGRAAEQRRREDARVDQELAEMERQKQAFYKGY